MNDQLLIRFITGRCTAKEVEQIDRWIAADEANADRLFETERLWSLKQEAKYAQEQQVNRAYERFLARQSPDAPKGRVTPLLSRWVRYGAAAAVVVGLLSLNLWQMQSAKSPSSINTVEVARGEKASITLSDGTKVWLNAQTIITYPSQFAAKTREVTIQGEAFFEVARDEGKPFIVRGDGFDVKVLGTRFNVSAHAGEDVSIALKEGKISVEAADSENHVVLRPGDQFQLTTSGRTILQKTDIATIDSWTSGEFVFTAQPLAVIARSLERTFDVPIVVPDDDLAWGELFNCRAKAGTGLPEIMELLAGTKRISYIMENDRIVITKTECL